MIGIDAYKNPYMQSGGASAFAGGGVANNNNSHNTNIDNNVFAGGKSSALRGTGASTGSYGAVQGTSRVQGNDLVSKLDKMDEADKKRQVKDAFRGQNLCCFA